MMPTVALAAGLLALAFFLRILPHRLSPAGVGIDHWFWKSYIETYRATRQFPPVLPQYILDEHQWYPPLFPLVMSRLPQGLFDRWSHIIAVLIDLLRMSVLMCVAYVKGGHEASVMVIAGLTYATIPIQITYNIQLNPRGLGALMLDGVLILLLWSYPAPTPLLVWVAAAVLGGLILLTHKMTTQVFWFIVLVSGLIYRDLMLVALMPASVVVALVLSRGFYWKVLRAHWDIVRFWNRHWRWIGADQIRESPIYGDGTYERAGKLHPSGVRGWATQGAMMFAYSPAAWITCLLVFERLLAPSALVIFPTFILVWMLLPCLLAVLTTYVNPLKCLGAGYLYVYNTSLLASLVLAFAYRYTYSPAFSQAFVSVAVCLNLIVVGVFYLKFIANKKIRIQTAFDDMLEHLKKQPRGVVMCVPAHWHEPVAYRTGMPVLWGAHGYGFRKLEPTFPRLLLPIRDVLAQYEVRYFLTMDDAVPENFLAELPTATVHQMGEYRLYDFG